LRPQFDMNSGGCMAARGEDASMMDQFPQTSLSQLCVCVCVCMCVCSSSSNCKELVRRVLLCSFVKDDCSEQLMLARRN